MRLTRALVALLLLLALACTPEAGEPSPQPQAGGGDAGAATDDEGQTAGEQTPSGEGNVVTAKPKAKVTGSCSEEPETEDGEPVLAADLEVRNTGNLGVRVRVAARWPLPQRSGVSLWHRVHLEPGDSTEVSLRLPVTEETAGGVRRMAAQDRTCSTFHRVIGAFGAPVDD